MAEINFDVNGAVQAYYQARDLWLAERGTKPLGVIAAEIAQIISPYIYNDPQGGNSTMANNMDNANFAANAARDIAASTGMNIEEVMTQTGRFDSPGGGLVFRDTVDRDQTGQGTFTYSDPVNSGTQPTQQMVTPSLQNKSPGKPWWQAPVSIAVSLTPFLAGFGASAALPAAGAGGGAAASTGAAMAADFAAIEGASALAAGGALGGAGAAGAGGYLGLSLAEGAGIGGGGMGVAAGGAAGAGAAGGLGALGGGGAVAGAAGGSSILSQLLVPAATALISSGVNAFMSSKAAEEQAQALMASANMSHEAAMAAIRAQVEGQASAIGYLREANAQARADVAPWLEAGKKALGTLEEKVAAGPGEFTKSPGYEFRLGEGLKAIESSAAARGQQLSGQTMKGMNDYAQNFATADYDNFLRRYYESLNPLETLAGIGQNVAGQTSGQSAALGGNLANLATGTASNIGNLGIAGANAMGQGIAGAGQARASGYINTANSITSPLNNISNLYTQYQMLSQLQGA